MESEQSIFDEIIQPDIALVEATVILDSYEDEQSYKKFETIAHVFSSVLGLCKNYNSYALGAPESGEMWDLGGTGFHEV